MVEFFSHFHLYGFIVGVAILIAISLCENKLRENNIHLSDNNIFFITVCGIIGARLWHVITDRHIYSQDIISAIFIWNGGLSILGGVIGGMLSSWILSKYKNISLTVLLDCFVFGLPIGQAFGRLGNYFNQELYGVPTQVPWGIFIDTAHRLPEFKTIEYYHPLFLYEALLTLIFGILVWFIEQKKSLIGVGWYIYGYLLYYSCIRFLLDTIRIDKPNINGLPIGINQLILLFVAVYSVVQLRMLYVKKEKNK